MANVTIKEDRTYTCLQGDKSPSLENTTPTNLNNSAYWTLMKYEVDEYVLVNSDSTIDSDANNTSGTIQTPLYRAGIYRCIAVDYDIKLSKVTTYSSLPTSNDPDAGTPLCFTRYADTTTNGTKQRSAIWQKKWKRIADLPAS